jgi:tetratricopeptide (TPR) repeat protein
MLYHQWGKVTEAEQSLRKAIKIYKDVGRLDDCAPIYGSLAKVYFDINKFDLAAKAATDALALYRQRSGTQEAIDVLENLLLEIRQKG